MKIVIISPTFYPNIGGVEKAVYNEICLLNEYKIDYFVITSDQGNSDKYYNNEIDIKNIVRLHSINILNQIIISPISLWKVINKIINNIKNDKYIFHIHTFTTPIALISIFFCFIRKYKFIVTLHYHPCRYHKFPYIVKLLELIASIFLKRAEFIIALTESEATEIRKFNKNVLILPYVLIELPRYNHFNITNRSDYFLFVGRLAHNKGIEKILYLAKKCRNLKIKICGRDVDGYIKILHRFRNIEYLGEVDKNKLKELYMDAKALILPSKYEAFGLVVQEALSYGLPVIISNNVKFSEFLKNTLLEKYIFDYNSDLDMVEKIKIFLKDTSDLGFYFKLCKESYEIAITQTSHNYFLNFLNKLQEII